MYLRLPTTFAVIFGSFTLGLYTAIQGPTLMDLIDLLHVNNDIMSYSLAFASLAYSVGGLLSGLLFEYVNRQLLISAFFLIFGISNIVTPFISNYFVFSVIMVFKMMCAGGTDCGANVWILEMWPGKDAWLQALHFSFAVGCALGPLIVEPFLSVETKESEIDKIAGKTSGTASINDQNSETRIHIPFGLSGLMSILASAAILSLYVLDQRHKRQMALLKAKQQAAAGEHILLTSIKHPAALEAGDTDGPADDPVGDEQAEREPLHEQELKQVVGVANQGNSKQVDDNALSRSAIFLQPSAAAAAGDDAVCAQQQQQQPNSTTSGQQHQQKHQQQTTDGTVVAPAANANQINEAPKAPPPQQAKITSKCREELSVRKLPYYVMFAILLTAMSLSFYCGIEITSMNYLATFAVNIDLQLNKSTAALMSSALTISFAVGRAFGIWMAAYMKPHKLFYTGAGIMAVSNLAMLVFANSAETLLWYSVCIFGIGCGPMFPAIVSFYDDKISKVTNTVSGIFILGSMVNVALNSLIIGHHIIDNALILIVCNLVGSVILTLLFGTLHMLTMVKRNQRVKKYNLKQQGAVAATDSIRQQEQQVALLQQQQQQPNQLHQSTDDSRREQQQPTSTNSDSNKNNNSNKGNDNHEKEDDHHNHVETTAATSATATISAEPIDQ